MTALALAAVPTGPTLQAVASGPAIGVVASGAQIEPIAGTAGVISVDAAAGAALVASGAASAAPVLALVALPVRPQGGALAIDLSTANTFRVSLDQNVAAVSFAGFPAAGRSERVTIYFVQDSLGGRTVVGWSNVRWSFGEPPELSTDPNAVDCVVLDVMDGGALIFGNLVGSTYS